MTYIDNAVGIDNTHVDSLIPTVQTEYQHHHKPDNRGVPRWLWWLLGALVLAALAWALTYFLSHPTRSAEPERTRIEVALNELAAKITDAYTNPNAPTAHVPAEQIDAEFPVPSFHYPAGLTEDASVQHEKEILSALLTDFGNLLTRYPELNAVYFGSTSGLTVRYMMPTLLDPNYDPRLRPWFDDSLTAGGQVFWTYPYADAFTGLQVVTGSKPVFAADGTLLGVVAVDLLYELD